MRATSKEESEEIVNDLIAVIWPRLDEGATKQDVMAYINNVLDAWTPRDGTEGSLEMRCFLASEKLAAIQKATGGAQLSALSGTEKTATSWAAETYGFADWCPQSAQEFISHCEACGFDAPKVREDGAGIWVEYDIANDTGSAPRVADGWALVAE